MIHSTTHSTMRELRRILDALNVRDHNRTQLRSLRDRQRSEGARLQGDQVKSPSYHAAREDMGI